MKKISCVIADDEPVARKVLREFIEQVSFLQLTKEFADTAKLNLFLNNNQTDIIFLDIEMPGKTGLDYLRGTNVKPLVVLTTAYPEYALEGYELDIIDYLLKPIAFERFLKAVNKAKDYTEVWKKSSIVSHPWIFVKSEKRIEKIELKDILYIESIGNYVKIHTVSKSILAYLTLKNVEEQLPSNDFIKIHQSYIVNLSAVNSIEGNQVKVGANLLPVGRNFKETIAALVDRHIIKRQAG